YSTDLFKRETMERFVTYFKNIVGSVIEDPTVRLSDIAMITPDERDELLHAYNDTAVAYPLDRTVIDLFEDQVEKTPDKVALFYCGLELSYKDLNQKANILGHRLKEMGIGPNDIIGVMTLQSMEMVFGILGILKSGAAFLPIDPSYPKERVDYMLKESDSRLVLSTKEVMDTVGIEKDFINLGDIDLHDELIPNPLLVNANSDLCYIIYTSGSTGIPKGVMVENCSLVNLCYWHNSYYQVVSSDNSTKFASFGFDASVWELFPYLLKGACIHIIHDDIRMDVKALNDYFTLYDITISFLPTQVCEQFVGLGNKTLRYLLTGGDKLRTLSKETTYTIVNNYGPTENCVVATSFKIIGKDCRDRIPIGRPIGNTKAYILGVNNQLLPKGTTGELCIG
ncbi:AMP-binding protein, partial [Maribacter sp. 2307UL18-2]|uniref:AMP-binding protein n=1 Tax=Maribacter sp. 2307UL18-2 TaxID=3386274 RepID=UPI0039BD6749